MAGITSSAIFRQFITDQLAGNVGGTTNVNFVSLALGGANGFRVALYGIASNAQTAPPSKDSTSLATGDSTNYGAVGSAWATGGGANAASASAPEVYNTGWGQGGVGLGSPTVTNAATGVVMFDAADTASLASTTLSNVYGSLIYVGSTAPGSGGVTAPTLPTTTLINRGVCWNYFGGANGVSAGVLTVVWNNSGIFRITV